MEYVDTQNTYAKTHLLTLRLCLQLSPQATWLKYVRELLENRMHT